MTVVRLESTTGPFFWYRQAQLNLYDNKLYDVGRYSNGNSKTFENALSITQQPIAKLDFNNVDRLSFLPKKYIFVGFYDLGFNASLYFTATLTQSRLTTDNPISSGACSSIGSRPPSGGFSAP